MTQTANPETLTEAQEEKFKQYAALIKNDKTLGHLLSQSSLANRHTMYMSLLPYLPFKPKPYWWFTRGRMKKIKEEANAGN
jgi:hypothetical protein